MQCDQCRSNYMMNEVPEDSNVYAFIRNKQYSGTCRLICPSNIFLHFAYSLDKLFTTKFSEICHMNAVVRRLVLLAKPLVNEFLGCDNCECKRKLLYGVKLFFTVRLHASLKQSNIENVVGTGKRNRKVLKLMHL